MESKTPQEPAHMSGLQERGKQAFIYFYDPLKAGEREESHATVHGW